ncbi:hypothetical protein KCU88_g3, partial [Aureobasidium melanogenum]
MLLVMSVKSGCCCCCCCCRLPDPDRRRQVQWFEWVFRSRRPRGAVVPGRACCTGAEAVGSDEAVARAIVASPSASTSLGAAVELEAAAKTAGMEMSLLSRCR